MSYKEVESIIGEQKKAFSPGSPEWGIAYQLAEIAKREPDSAELLEKDLQTEGMGIKDAAKKLEAYADQNHGKERCYCIAPDVAEKILREFYGLPSPEEKPQEEPEKKPAEILDITDFL